MKSDAPSEQKTIVKVGHIEKRRKKIVVPPQYLKMSDNTHHKLFVEKLKSRPFTPARSPRGAQIHLSLPETSSSAFGRVTPEGDGSFIFPKSVSEIDLWRSGEKTDLLVSQKRVVLRRILSFESLKDMPAYGDVIVDKFAEEGPVMIARTRLSQVTFQTNNMKSV